jgi:hypothetical protein
MRKNLTPVDFPLPPVPLRERGMENNPHVEGWYDF